MGYSVVNASGINVPGENLGLQPITLPLFLSPEFIKNFSVFSYLAYLLDFVFIGITLLWVYLIIRAAVQIIQSEGDSSKIEDSKKKFGNVFWSVTFLFGFFIVMNLVGVFLNVGTFLDWPKSFSICQSGFGKGKYYFNYYLEVQGKAGPYVNVEDIKRQVNRDCFGT
jgi:hypothetical protein